MQQNQAKSSWPPSRSKQTLFSALHINLLLSAWKLIFMEMEHILTHKFFVIVDLD